MIQFGETSNIPRVGESLWVDFNGTFDIIPTVMIAIRGEGLDPGGAYEDGEAPFDFFISSVGKTGFLLQSNSTTPTRSPEPSCFWIASDEALYKSSDTLLNEILKKLRTFTILEKASYVEDRDILMVKDVNEKEMKRMSLATLLNKSVIKGNIAASPFNTQSKNRFGITQNFFMIKDKNLWGRFPRATTW